MVPVWSNHIKNDKFQNFVWNLQNHYANEHKF